MLADESRKAQGYSQISSTGFEFKPEKELQLVNFNNYTHVDSTQKLTPSFSHPNHLVHRE